MTNLTENFEQAKADFENGLLASKSGDWESAENHFRRSLQLIPGRASTLTNLFGSLIMQNKIDDAWQIADEVVRLDPDNPTTNTNVGILHQKAGNFTKALHFLDKALSIDQNNVSAKLNKGKVLLDQNDTEQAIDYFDEALRLEPKLEEARFCKSIAYLVSGNFEQGWPLYEARWTRSSRNKSKQFKQPLWLGHESLKDKTILLHAEQGLGDTINFCRFASDIKRFGCRVILAVQPPVLELLKTLEGVDMLIDESAPLPHFDYHCPLMSLPLALGVTVHTIPAAEHYLEASDTKIKLWSERLGQKKALRVGIAWSGSTTHANDRDRSIALEEFLLCLPQNCEIISLQKEVRAKDRSIITNTASIRHFGKELTDFSDTAALCALVDVVVSVDTSVAHLAGALGVNVKTLIAHKPDYRWLLNRKDTPWYSSMTLYRQGLNRQWSDVLHKVKAHLS